MRPPSPETLALPGCPRDRGVNRCRETIDGEGTLRKRRLASGVDATAICHQAVASIVSGCGSFPSRREQGACPASPDVDRQAAKRLQCVRTFIDVPPLPMKGEARTLRRAAGAGKRRNTQRDKLPRAEAVPG